jgi:fused signal recognition particle receptor
MDSLTILVVVLVAVVGIVASFFAVRFTQARKLPSARPPAPKRNRLSEKPTVKEPEAERAKKPKPAAVEVAKPAQAAAKARESEKPAEVAAAQVESEQKPARVSEASPPKRPSWFPKEENVAALRKGLSTTRSGLVSRLAKLFANRAEIKPELLEEIEEILITADVGAKTSAKILSHLKSQMDAGELRDEESVWRAIRARAQEILSVKNGRFILRTKPAVVLVIGVNGVGKTTTIGKIAHQLKIEDKKIILVAGDTFRAAAVLQLEVWGRRVNCPVVKGKENADPSSVVFDAVKKAIDEDYDAVIVDTAGRLHTKLPLMEELKKINRTVAKATGGRAADEVLLVLDATIGQNAIQQVQIFKEALEDISGIALTKMDGTAKGGVILAICDEHQIPVRFIGIGEKLEDLREFSPEEFVEALFSKGEETTAT